MPKDKEVRVKILGDSNQAKKALDDIAKHASKVGDILGKAIKIGAVAATAAIGGVAAFMKQSVDEAAKAEKAEIMLAQAMQQHGTYTDEALESLKKYASELQKVTTFGDDETLSAMQRLQTYGMEVAQMKEAVRVAQDLAAAKGIDLKTATDLVGRAYAGNTGTLSRYGIVLDQARIQAEGFSYVLGEMNKMFGGAAQAEAETYAGRLEQMKNAWGDLQEVVGFAVLPSLKDMMTSLTDVFVQLQKSGAIENLLTPLGDAVQQLLPMLGEVIGSIADMFAESDIIPTIVSVFSNLVGMLSPIIQELGPPLLDIANTLGSLLASIMASLAPVIQALAPIIADIVRAVADFLRRNAPIISRIAELLADIVSRVLVTMEPYIQAILDAVMRIIDALLPFLPTLLELAEPFLGLLEQIMPYLTKALEIMGEIAGMIVGALGEALSWAIGAIGKFGDIWSAVWHGVEAVFRGVWDGIVWVKDNVIMPIVNFLRSMWDGLKDAWDEIWGTLKGIVKTGVLGVLKVIRGLVHALDWAIPGGATGKVDEWIRKVEAWHQGGWIPGVGEKAIPLGLFEGGEYVIRREAARTLGPDVLEYLNRGMLPALASPGVTINIHVDHMYGDRVYVDLLAERIAERLPAVHFRRWSRV